MILETIAEDATRYFLVIFTSHFVLVMTLNLGRVSVTISLCVGCHQWCLIGVSLGIDPAPSSIVSRPRNTEKINILTCAFGNRTISGSVV